jgi:hypothetical protein
MSLATLSSAEAIFTGPVPVPVLLGTAVLVWTDRLGEGRVANVVEPDDIAGGAGVLVGAELVDCTNVGV